MTWRELAHPATVDVFDRYRLDAQIQRCVNDPVVGDDGGLTTTRDYKTYADAFETAADRKWLQIKDFVRPGRILDIGCATGATLQLIDADPRFHESDLIGVEVARHLYAECVHKKEQGLFHNPNVYFYQRNMLGSTVFPPRSIDTTLTLALTHEIWSYADGSRPATVQRFADALFAHTAPGGVWVNSDVCGPAEPERSVVLALDDSDGANPSDVSELEALREPAEYIAGLSTRARFFQFAHDFRRNAKVPFAYTEQDGKLVLRLADAMDFLTRKDYVDNWLSETHEQFCGLNFAGWSAVAKQAGFTHRPGLEALAQRLGDHEPDRTRGKHHRDQRRDDRLAGHAPAADRSPLNTQPSLLRSWRLTLRLTLPANLRGLRIWAALRIRVTAE